MERTVKVCFTVLVCVMFHLTVSDPCQCANPPERYAVVLTAGEGCTYQDKCPKGLGEDPIGMTDGFWSNAVIIHDMLIHKYCFS